MDDTQVIPSQNIPDSQPEDKSSGVKKIFLVVLGLILLSGIGAASFYLGGRNKKTEEIATEATTSPIPTTAQEETTPTLTSSISGTLTPTKKPTITLSPTPTPTPPPKSKTLSATTSLDGFRSSNGGGNATVDIRAGRNVNLVTRGFVSFDLSEIPSGAEIKEANMRLYQVKTVGNPYTAGGALKVDHLNYGDTLDNSDYAMAALLSSFVTLTSNNVVEWKDAIVTSQVKDDIANGRSRSQFRIHFTTEVSGGDATGDFAYFVSAENKPEPATGNTPQLVIKYY